MLLSIVFSARFIIIFVPYFNAQMQCWLRHFQWHYADGITNPRPRFRHDSCWLEDTHQTVTILMHCFFPLRILRKCFEVCFIMLWAQTKMLIAIQCYIALPAKKKLQFGREFIDWTNFEWTETYKYRASNANRQFENTFVTHCLTFE